MKLELSFQINILIKKCFNKFFDMFFLSKSIMILLTSLLSPTLLLILFLLIKIFDKRLFTKTFNIKLNDIIIWLQFSINYL